MHGKTLFVATGLALVSLALGVPASAAEFSHAGGFVCGELANTNNRILGGDHRTHFNIRNGNKRAVTVNLELALGFPAADPAPNGASFTPGATTALQSVELQPGEAVMIDCDEILTAALGLDADPPPYFSGILDARSRQPLQVTRTQTAGPNGEDISSLSVTEIESKRVGRRDDNDEDDRE
jgi:hypothetical protein